MSERASAKAYCRLLLASIALTFTLVVLGGVVRVTGSGLGCPDWPACHGSVVPLLNTATILEYSHRFVALLVSALVVTVGIFAWKDWRRDRPVLLTASLAQAVLAVQVGLGAVTVLYELPPSVVSVHLVTAEVLLGLLVLLYLLIRRRHPLFRYSPTRSHPGAGALWLTGAGVLAVSALIISGAYVRSTGATYHCTLWPFCGPELLPSEGLPGYHMAHRLVTLVSGLLLLAMLWASWRQRKSIPGGGRLSVVTAILFACQVGVGAFMVYTGFTPLSRSLHLATATGVWMGVIALAVITWQARSSDNLGPPLMTPEVARRAPYPSFLSFLALTKPAIVGMLLLTALGGAFLAAGGLPPLVTTLGLVLGGGLTSAGASAINGYLDRDIDRQMRRTSARPLPSHRMSPASALAFGVALNGVGFLVMASVVNMLSAVLALAASGFYVFVYTGWLKRSTPQNIVIGGAAGAMTPVIGWAAVTNSIALPALYLFVIVFLWTPPHFWSLALLVKEDYARANIPMLPVARGERYTFWAIGSYVLVLMVTTLIFHNIGNLGAIYLLSALLLGSIFVGLVAGMLFRGGRGQVVRIYRYSMLYLGLLFLAIIADSFIKF